MQLDDICRRPDGSIDIDFYHAGACRMRGQAVRELKEAGVQAIAICFLFSYLDPAHEARAMEIVREEYPECFATTSSSVSPQFREFERFTTTAMNAFVGPKVRNVPKEGYYAWDPGGYIGLYQPDTFWIAR